MDENLRRGMISTTEIHVPSPVESRPGIVPLQECNYVNNEFITDVFTPVSVLCNQPLGVSRAVDPLPCLRRLLSLCSATTAARQ